MWCAVHVGKGNETKTEEFMTELLPESLCARCFHLTRSRRKKFGGQWQTIQENLLPGYVFVDTEQPEAVYKVLKKSRSPRLLFGSADFVAALKAEEAAFLGRITDKDGGIGLSMIRVAEKGEVSYLTGPLQQVGHLVRKIDLHRRIAEVEADFMGERQVLYLGIEIAE